MDALLSLYSGFICALLLTGNYHPVNAQTCPEMCVCVVGEDCEDCDPYYYKQPIPAPQPTPPPVPLHMADANDTTSTSTTTTPTTTTIASSITTTTAPPETTTTLEILTYKCVSQCNPGWYGDPINGTCEVCLVESCSMCTENGTVCLVCDDGHHIAGNSCEQFSPAEIALIALTCIFGTIFLVVIIVAVIVLAVRYNYCSFCGTCPCACSCATCELPCQRGVKQRRPSVRKPAPSVEELDMSIGKKGVERNSSGGGRYVRDPTLRRKDDMPAVQESTYKDDPEYPQSYTTPINADIEGQQGAENDDYYDDVDDPQKGDGVPREAPPKPPEPSNKKPTFMGKFKLGKKKKQTAQPAEQQQEVTTTTKGPHKFTREQQQQPGLFGKQKQPTPPDSDDGDVYNDVADPDDVEYGDTADDVPGCDSEPLYENMAQINAAGGISGANAQVHEPEQVQGKMEPFYNNTDGDDNAYYNVSQNDGVLRNKKGRLNVPHGRTASNC